MLVGEETRITKDWQFGAFATGHADARLMNITSGTNVALSDLEDAQTKVVANSLFATLEYNFKEKYYFYSSIRRDGSSKFAPDHRWGTFWSLGVKWDA